MLDKMMKITLFFFLTTPLFALNPELQQNLEEPDLRLFLTGQVYGNIDGCDCASHPRAGFSRIAWFLKDNQTKPGDFILDTGSFSTADNDPFLDQAMLEEMEYSGYLYQAVGFNDFSSGPASLMALMAAYPLYCDNLTFVVDGQKVYSIPSEIYYLNNRSIGLISLIDPEYQLRMEFSGESRAVLDSPEPILKQRLKQTSQADLVIVTYYGPRTVALELVKNRPGVDILIIAGEDIPPSFEVIDQLLILSPGFDSNYLLQVDLSLKNQGMEFKPTNWEFSYNDDPADAHVLARKDLYYEEYATWLTALTENKTKEQVRREASESAVHLSGFSAKEEEGSLSSESLNSIHNDSTLSLNVTTESQEASNIQAFLFGDETILILSLIAGAILALIILFIRGKKHIK